MFIGTLVLTTLLTALVTKFVRVSVLQASTAGSARCSAAARPGAPRRLRAGRRADLAAALARLDQSAAGYSLAQTVIQLKPWLPPALANRLKYN